MPAETKHLLQQTDSRERIAAFGSGLVLALLNLYVSRELFRNPTAYMNSMHGFWIAIAKLGGVSWFHSHWWPYWDGGMPTEFTYAPLLPTGIAALNAIGVSRVLAFQWITGIVYCLAPVTLFVMAWRLTRAPLAAFAAGLVYSLTSLTRWIVPDGPFSWSDAVSPRRFYVVAVWDDTPHLTALALLPLVVVLLWRTLEKPRWRYVIPMVILISLMTSASQFGPMEVAIAAISMVFVFPKKQWRRNLAIVAAVGALSYGLAATVLSPSLIRAIGAASSGGGEGVSANAYAAFAALGGGFVALVLVLRRWNTDPPVQFFVLFAYVASSVPVLSAILHLRLLPQPVRYRLEMEMALALLIAFGLRPFVRRLPRFGQLALLVLFFVLARQQLIAYRHYVRNIMQPRDVKQTIEYRASVWAEQNLGSMRVMLPGSIGQWASVFTGVVQYGGGSWSQAINRQQQDGEEAIYCGGSSLEEHRRIALAWLAAYGVGAVAVSGPRSEEYWKRYTNPTMFDGVLPVLWSDHDVTFYRVPQKSLSLAHVVPLEAIVSRRPLYGGDIAGIEQYVHALQVYPALPDAEFAWQGTDHARVRLAGAAQRALSLQITYHPGWRASRDGQPLAVHRDGLGLMWLEPACAGPCEIRLDYDGGWELRICRWFSLAVLAALVLLPLLYRRRAA